MAAESTRLTLMKSMRSLTRKKSFSKITVNDICDVSRVSRRTFYRYFKDKYDILENAYRELFFEKLDITETADIWDVLEKLCSQMYDDQDFFFHAFQVKEQNGFWQETIDLLFPYYRECVPTDELTAAGCDWFVRQDLFIMCRLLEEWICGGFTLPPHDIALKIRRGFAIHGKWQYQSAMRKPMERYEEGMMEEGIW